MIAVQFEKGRTTLWLEAGATPGRTALGSTAAALALSSRSYRAPTARGPWAIPPSQLPSAATSAREI
jgi:hypothetical protein